MYYLLLTIYLLIGFQVGARVFYWGRRISKDGNFLMPLIIVPIFWPFILLAELFDPDPLLKKWDKG